MPDDETQQPLHLPRGMRYSCVQCGLSCRMFNEVGLEEESRRKIEEVDYQRLLPEDWQDQTPWEPSRIEPDRTVLCKNEDGTCVFLGKDRLCTIHKAHGFHQKPQTCQDFPFRYVETPGGVYVGLSFACTAVLGDEGTPVEDQREELEAQYPRSVSRRETPSNIRLTTRHEITWEAFLALEEDMLAILRHEEGTTIGERLAAQSVYLDMVVALLREARNDSPTRAKPATPQSVGGGERFPPDAGPEMDVDVVLTVRQRFIENANGLANLFRLARRPRPSPGLQRAFLGLMTAFRQNLRIRGKTPGRAATVMRIFHHYLSHMMKLGRVNLEAAGARFPYSEFPGNGAAIEQDEDQRALLFRFYNHVFQRKDILLEENLWMGHRLLLMHYALIRWHLVGLKAMNRTEGDSIELLQEAIRQVERHYMFHVQFGQLFEKFPALGMVLDSIVRKPTYAASMIGPAV